MGSAAPNQPLLQVTTNDAIDGTIVMHGSNGLVELLNELRVDRVLAEHHVDVGFFQGVGVDQLITTALFARFLEVGDGREGIGEEAVEHAVQKRTGHIFFTLGGFQPGRSRFDQFVYPGGVGIAGDVTNGEATVEQGQQGFPIDVGQIGFLDGDQTDGFGSDRGR